MSILLNPTISHATTHDSSEANSFFGFFHNYFSFLVTASETDDKKSKETEYRHHDKDNDRDNKERGKDSDKDWDWEDKDHWDHKHDWWHCFWKKCWWDDDDSDKDCKKDKSGWNNDNGCMKSKDIWKKWYN